MPAKKNVTHQDVAHMAELSRLHASPEEQTLFARQFGDILAYMDVLESVNTEGVEPLYSPALHTGFLRDDVPHRTRTREEVLGTAPETDGEYFLVPRIV
ncbi:MULTISPECIES: Asp-tRNA(Asn)/Glu-tRNA(Gln) amidotransferase subunit GatC [unclassified Desulfovibrio]|uniref:Asp-tRNA(Asn)/Glu-tRNA(Gln) amidotransferase subunit GatC n=1 Tax=unclassified Desulfovibrio TaxID=2593640 RepID=UPI000F5DE7E6|nr:MULTISPECIES: Asp-tRNA(Asn)/Glu-tRNA(Gln) amidotransferase subunit GatC [unclassified Desulfovibrio]RRD70907.1 Asp-tRNA(Asn)/Glu-tRNA(Gln) amidotransferase subunit GatC [Desulfovibrio sp. OH1209_COT-279]RRD87280.1 Asp-tRNA(Asn)/Glu-tRNA(Gln) amidotransferase subunit GatC [Desulfovibrio sp. OH1186_COT-070]